MTRILFLSRSLTIGIVAVVLNSWPISAQAPPRCVLLLYPFDNAQLATTIAGAAVRKRLADKSSATQIDVYADFLDLARFPGEADELRVGRSGRKRMMPADLEKQRSILSAPQSGRRIWNSL